MMNVYTKQCRDKEYHQQNVKKNDKSGHKNTYWFHSFKVKDKIKTIKSLEIKVRIVVIFGDV